MTKQYAVASGGGSSHRLDLSAMVLLKETVAEADITVDGTGLLCVTLLIRLRAAIAQAKPSRVPSYMSSRPTRLLRSTCRPGAI
ncbi:hypothetical protein AB0O76_16315 [Streptomyces sp. NPDC086554]|uniref:hypothetical protein n=1 Tax=Streptomyces sp. NPDC086554 TaxID=3154864 RepID=UPI003436F159